MFRTAANRVVRVVAAVVTAAAVVVASPHSAHADPQPTTVHVGVSGAVDYSADWVDSGAAVSIRPAVGEINSLRVWRHGSVAVTVNRLLVFDVWFGTARIVDADAGMNVFLPFVTDQVTRSDAGVATVAADGWTWVDLRFRRFSLNVIVTPDVSTGDPVLVGAGDISLCPLTSQFLTANLLDEIPGTVFTLGDNAYPDGAWADFRCYDLSWGRHRWRTRPSVGNHEYHSPGAAPYYSYFGSAAGEPGKGWYSYDLGSWHVVVLNSNCDKFVGGCGPDSEQVMWLTADLAAHPAQCTLAYWHHPRFSSSSNHGSDPGMQTFWDVLHAAGADVVLSGHDHDYERFAPQTGDGQADPETGIREFVVGTGGNILYDFGPAAPNSEVRNSSTWGVLKLTLHDGSYDWQFVPISGQFFSDSGAGSCH